MVAGRVAAVDGVRRGLSGDSVELTALRTPFSARFANADGTTTVRVFDEVAFVPDGAGSLVEFDATLRVRDEDGRLAPAAAAAVSFSVSSQDAQLARLDLGGGRFVGFGVVSARAILMWSCRRLRSG
jgi:hypothetical protein